MEHISNKIRTVRFEKPDPLFSHGFTQIPNSILNMSNLSAGAILVYAKLLEFAWDKNHCWPAQKTIEEQTSLGLRSVERHIKELKDKELIEVIRHGLGKPNTYILKKLVRKKSNRG